MTLLVNISFCNNLISIIHYLQLSVTIFGNIAEATYTFTVDCSRRCNASNFYNKKRNYLIRCMESNDAKETDSLDTSVRLLVRSHLLARIRRDAARN